MNPAKVNNGWILCPSKSFPGKHYYFNMHNGEAVWSPEYEKNLSSNSHINKLCDKSHCYPEPKNPPEDSRTSLNIQNMSMNRNFIRQPEIRRVFNNPLYQSSTPMFGQAVFPKYVSNLESYQVYPDVVWAPVRLPPLMYGNNTETAKRPNVSRVTQTSDDVEQSVVQACDNSLSKRFSNYNKSTINRSHETSTAITTRNESTNTVHSFPTMFIRNKVTSPKNILSEPKITKASITEPIFKRVHTKSETHKSTITSPELYGISSVNIRDQTKTNLFTKNNQSREPIKRKIQTKLDNKSNIKTEACQTYNFDNITNYDACTKKLKQVIKVGERFEEITKTPEAIPKLRDNDLRLVLIAKRRKSVDLGETRGVADKKIKTYKVEQKPVTNQHKRVTFDIQDQVYDESYNENEDCVLAQTSDDRDPLDLHTDLCYVMADSDTLFDEFKLIEEYVLSDENARLLLPARVQSVIESMFRPIDRNSRQVVPSTPRHTPITRSHIVTMPEIDISNDAQDISDVLKYCLSLTKNGYKVVFVTNSTKLYTEAKSLNIPCLNTKEIKPNKTPESKADFETVKIKSDNDNYQENIFLKPASEFKSYLFSVNEQFPVNSLKTPIFYHSFNNNNMTEVNKVDANTSPIPSDVINIINNKPIETYENRKTDVFNNEKAAADFDIGRKNLFLLSDVENTPKTLKFNTKIEIKNKKLLQDGTKKVASETENSIVDRNKWEFNANNLFKTHENQIDTFSDLNEKEICFKTNYSKFDIKNDLMEETIKNRLDDLVCTFSQLIEDVLNQVLLRHSKNVHCMNSRWVLYDVVVNVKKLYDKNKNIKYLADKFTMLLLEECFQFGQLNPSMAPRSFMKLFECGFLLIEALKAEEPYIELFDAQDHLNKLLNEIQNPRDDLDKSLLIPICRSESPDVNIVVKDLQLRSSFARDPSDIIDYLKNNFVEWKNYKKSLEQDFETKMPKDKINDLKIIRTFGRNLKLLNLNGKSMTVMLPDETTKEITENTQENKEKSNIKISEVNQKEIDSFNLATLDLFDNGNAVNKDPIIRNSTPLDKDLKKSIVKKELDSVSLDYSEIGEDSDLSKAVSFVYEIKNKNEITENTQENKEKSNIKISEVNQKEIDSFNLATLDLFDNGNAVNKDPIIRNSTPLDKDLKKSIVKKELDSVSLDYSEIGEDSDLSKAVSFVYEIKNKNVKTEQNSDVKNEEDSNNDVLMRSITVDNFDSDFLNVKDDVTNDSGFENESLHAHSLVKSFLFEMAVSFKLIYSFINKSNKDFREDRLHEDEKQILLAKVKKSLLIIIKIIEKLKRIIQREANDSTTLKAMLLSAGTEVTKDKRMMRYRQVVTKCLEQALTLRNGLKIMLSFIGDDCEGSLSQCTIDTNIRYFNIFE